MNTGKSILGIIAGAAVGAAIGVLYAPEKGVETRKKISAKGRELSDDVEKKFSNLSSMINDKLDAIKNEVQSHRAANNGNVGKSMAEEMTSSEKAGTATGKAGTTTGPV